MNVSEFQKAKKYLDTLPIVDSRKDLEIYLEAIITVHGHAWCMDVKNERKKMARLIVSSLIELQ